MPPACTWTIQATNCSASSPIRPKSLLLAGKNDWSVDWCALMLARMSHSGRGAAHALARSGAIGCEFGVKQLERLVHTPLRRRWRY
jgi:hypothetical protein